MSAQELADACTEIGHTVPRSVIANMESGRRASLPLVDVMVLAQALETNPICLIVPVGYVERYQALPLHSYDSAWDALSWFTGEDNSLFSGWNLRLFRLHHAALGSAQEAAGKAAYYRDRASNAPDPQRRTEALRSAERFEQLAAGDHDTLRRVRAQMRQVGLLLPQLVPDLNFIDEHPHDLNNPEENDA